MESFYYQDIEFSNQNDLDLYMRFEKIITKSCDLSSPIYFVPMHLSKCIYHYSRINQIQITIALDTKESFDFENKLTTQFRKYEEDWGSISPWFYRYSSGRIPDIDFENSIILSDKLAFYQSHILLNIPKIVLSWSR